MKMVTMVALVLSLIVMFSMAGLTEAQEKGKSIELRMATGARPFQRFYKAAEEWMSLVEKGTNGAVKLNYYRLKGGRFEYRAKALFKKKNQKALNDWPPASIAII